MLGGKHSGVCFFVRTTQLRVLLPKHTRIVSKEPCIAAINLPSVDFGLRFPFSVSNFCIFCRLILFSSLALSSKHSSTKRCLDSLPISSTARRKFAVSSEAALPVAILKRWLRSRDSSNGLVVSSMRAMTLQEHRCPFVFYVV